VTRAAEDAVGHDGAVAERSVGSGAAHVVRLVAFPDQLFAAAYEQWQGMLREYTLRGIGGAAQSYRDDEITRAGNALRVVADAVERTAMPAEPPPSTPRTVPLEVTAPGDFSVLQGILDDARRLAISGELLVFPSLPEIVALRNWLCEEVVEQAAGTAPNEWRLDGGSDDAADTAAAEWDRSLAPPPDTAWLVGDDHNRIVAASPTALELLGWSADELVGQRLLAVIPHHLREAHIASFTRSVVSGEAPLLGQPLALPALTLDGRQIPITLTLTRHAARAGRHVYLARLDPTEALVPPALST
jgi:PAS domain S-box-containing protein